MNDERPFERLATHAGPAEADEAFGDRLYAVVHREMNRPQPSMGRILLLVAALLAAGTITGALAVGSGLLDPPWVNRLLIPTASAAASGLVEPSSAPTLGPPSGPPSASMITPARVLGTATLLPDGTVLVAGGTDDQPDGSDPIASAELLDPASETWVATGSMLESRAGQTATLLSNGLVLVVGGSSGDGHGTALLSAELYDPFARTWMATGAMSQARAWHAATLLTDGRVLVVGGMESTDVGVGGYDRLASAELYDPDTGTWTATADMTKARDGHTATLLPDGWVLVAGGSSAELLDPDAETWIATDDMTEPYYGHTATLLLDGTVLVAGGDAPSGPGARAWPHAGLYDWVTATWDATQKMITPRLGHTATLLPDGRVLVLGGRVHGGAASPLLRDAELYDPDTGRWAAIGDMIDARSGHTATLLPDGRVLVLGGAGFELYDPAGQAR
jgi:N-acetylneuraminic acid mutarotase